MNELFSTAWMTALQNAWNREPHVYAPLEKAGFSSRIAYGFKGEETPRGMIVIDNGKVTTAGAYDGAALDWDLRATPENWRGWLEKGFGLARLGTAVATKQLEFRVGNYRR